MAIRIFSLLISLFAIVFTALSLQEPYSLNLNNYSLNFKNIEASDLSAYELNQTSVKSYYKADSWTRYEKKDEFENFINLNLDFNVSAKKVEFLSENMDKLLFVGDASYINDDIKIFSDEVEYNLKDKTISTNSTFRAFVGENIINGDSLNYEIKNKILKIQGVNAWLREN